MLSRNYIHLLFNHVRFVMEKKMKVSSHYDRRPVRCVVSHLFPFNISLIMQMCAHLLSTIT